MPFGLGPFGWSFWYPYPQSYNPFWYGYQPWYPSYGAPWPSPSKEDEIRVLEDQAMALKAELERVNQRLQELKK